MHRAPVVCSIIPPHIHRHIAEHGDEKQRRLARLALEVSSHMRGQRDGVAGMRAALAAAAPAGKHRSVYDARHKRTLPGKLVREEGAKSTKDKAADEAYDGSGKTYDFYHDVFGRNSIDGNGLRLDSSVHYATDYSNAQWNGRQMLYGDGDERIFTRFTKALDVIGHELTHGVTQYSAALDYHDQSGALNEHFSDVFGILVKQYSLRQPASKSDWLIGAGLFTPQVHGSAIRSMKSPGTAYNDPILGRDPQPGHMKNYVKTHDDSGGVHINSGIPNHVFYLLATALGGNAWEVAGKIWYVTLTQKLPHDAQFQTCADTTFAVAGELFGAASEPQKAVAAAWKAAGIEVSPKAAEKRLPIRKRAVKAPAVDAPTFEPGAEVPALR